MAKVELKYSHNEIQGTFLEFKPLFYERFKLKSLFILGSNSKMQVGRKAR
jgi:hypothetical protein